ncbi:hypothetical protein, partial [Enterobacter hormaechei]
SPLWGEGEGRKVRSDALTPALSHGEREKTLGRHFYGLVLIEHFVHHATIGQRLGITEVNGFHI